MVAPPGAPGKNASPPSPRPSPPGRERESGRESARMIRLDGDDPRPVGGDGADRGLEVPDAGGVQAEDLRLDLVGELRVAVALDELVRDPELAEGVDLPLRVAPQGRVRPTHAVARPEAALPLSHDACARERTAAE